MHQQYLIHVLNHFLGSSLNDVPLKIFIDFYNQLNHNHPDHFPKKNASVIFVREWPSTCSVKRLYYYVFFFLL